MDIDAEEQIETFIAARGLRPSWSEIESDLRPQTIAEGYRLQSAIHQRIGGRVGYKVGSTSAAGQRLFGLQEPVYAGLFATDRSADLRQALARPYRSPSLECEIAFVLSRDLDAAHLSRTNVASAIGACHLACEIIDNRYGDPAAVGVPSLIADDFFQAGFVLGPANPDWRNQDLHQVRASMTINGQRFEGAASEGLDAYTSLTWLVEKRRHLAPGEIVLTGAIVGPVSVALPAKDVELAITGFVPMAFPMPS